MSCTFKCTFKLVQSKSSDCQVKHLFLLEVTCALAPGPWRSTRFNSACVCVCLSVRYQTPFSSRHESGPSLFLSTGKHPVGGQLPRVFFSALPGQSSDRPTYHPTKNFRFFSFLSPVFASSKPAPGSSSISTMADAEEREEKEKKTRKCMFREREREREREKRIRNK